MRLNGFCLHGPQTQGATHRDVENGPARGYPGVSLTAAKCAATKFIPQRKGPGDRETARGPMRALS